MTIGDKVVCIDDSVKLDFLIAKNTFFRQWVKEGKEYTIRAILNNDDIVVGVLLEEIVLCCF